MNPRKSCDPQEPPPRKPRWLLRRTSRAAKAFWSVVVVASVVLWASPAAGAVTAPSLNGVISNLRTWLVGLLVGLATLLLTWGGIRYLTAGGDPVQIDKAKSSLKSAAIGYVLAALAPLIVAMLQSVVR
ncbi:MAG: pilin [Acidimicrobiales bacterium]